MRLSDGGALVLAVVLLSQSPRVPSIASQQNAVYSQRGSVRTRPRVGGESSSCCSTVLQYLLLTNDDDEYRGVPNEM